MSAIDHNHLTDLRTSKSTEIGVIKEVSGDGSMLFCTTEKGFRLVLEGYSARQIAKFIRGKCDKDG